jgi:hypothetical protein
VGLVYAGSAASLSFLGSGWLTRTVTYRALRDRGADQVLASWVIGASAIASNGALLIVAVLGAAMAKTGGTAVAVLASIGLLALVVAATVLLVRSVDAATNGAAAPRLVPADHRATVR